MGSTSNEGKWGWLRASEANSSLRHDDKAACQPVPIPIEEAAKRLDFACRAFIFEAQENDALVRAAIPVDLFSKSLVVIQKRVY